MVVADRNIEHREIKSAACRLSMVFPLMLVFKPEVYPRGCPKDDRSIRNIALTLPDLDHRITK